ncbi:MAG: hypothetical protein NVV59_20745 [Chitinophagaceae bacterium]|nr:hypothetical protein [Chitinophagaceae bacterium]
MLPVTSLLLLPFTPSAQAPTEKEKLASGDILDSMIGVVIILFILSVITEKLTQLIRKYSPFIRPGDALYNTNAANIWQNIRKKQTDGTLEDDKIEREVNSLSFIIGLSIAIIFCVDIFRMFTAASPYDYLYWSDDRWTFIWEKHKWLHRFPLLLISFCLTGFFLTFGSKFFHDLLDLLFQAKNLKRKMVDPNTYESDNIQDFDEYLYKSYSSLIAMAIEQNRGVFQVVNAVSPPMHGRMRKNGRLVDCIDIHLSGNDRNNIPQTVFVKLESGRTVVVPVNVILEVETPVALFQQGSSTANKATSGYMGTICCKVMRNQQPLLLTCSHVLTGGTKDNLRGPINPTPAQINGQDAGSFVYGLCTDEFDIALIDTSSAPFNYAIQPKEPRRPSQTDIKNTQVRIVCRNNRIKTGTITNERVTEPLKIEYKGNSEHSITNLMVISHITETDGETYYTGVTEEGDSGACVYDQDNNPIGMIVAGNSRFSYAIPIVAILSKISATIIKQNV